MKRQTDGELNQNQKVKNFNPKLWICIISGVLALALVAVGCLGAALFVSYDKIAGLNATNEKLESLAAELVEELGSINDELKQSNEKQESLKNSLAVLEEKLTTLENTNQAAQSEIDQLKSEIASLKEQLDAYQTAPENKIRIYIDQGHNPTSYHNSGAYGNGIYEHDVTFLIGCILADLLRADGRFEVQLSRPNKSVVLGTDGKSSVMARVEGAIAFEADYLISLHTNSYTSDSPNGIEVWVPEGSNEAYVLGETLLNRMVERTNLKKRGMNFDAELDILEYSPMPAIVLEMGFISNGNDAAVLSEHPELFAEGIYNGILEYFGFLPKNSNSQ